ncbi:MAG TPA: hypothetical protein VF828_03775 [Patescibacteria group bacterium]
MKQQIQNLGFYSALAAFFASLGYDIVQVLQVVGVLKFPYDAISIYFFSLLIPIPFVLAILSLHYSVDKKYRIWTHAALLFSVIYAVYVVLNYVVQLTTVIPATLNGTLSEFKVLDQTPHSLFWDIDALGYIFMGFATLFAAPAFVGRGIEKWIKRFFIANAAITPVIALVYFYPTFSYTLLLLATPWMFTASGSILLLAIFFKRNHA